MRVTFEAPITRPVLAAGFFVGKHHIWWLVEATRGVTDNLRLHPVHDLRGFTS